MEKAEILKMLTLPVEMRIVLGELDRIEAFATSDLVPYDKHYLDAYSQLGIEIIKRTEEKDKWITFIKAKLPVGWKKRLNKKRDWRVELMDSKERVRAIFNYKPYDYVRVRFFNRFQIDIRSKGEAVTIVIIDNLLLKCVYRKKIDKGDFCENRDKGILLAKKWLNKKYPDWQLFNAYWD